MSSQFSYTVVMMNMNILAVVTPPSIYQGSHSVGCCGDVGIDAEFFLAYGKPLNEVP